MGISTNRPINVEPKQHLIIHSFRALAGIERTGSGTWPVTNLAIYIPFTVTEQITIKRILVRVGTSSGNIDVGIYDTDGTRRVSSGSTAMAAAYTTQSVDIADTALSPGTYYMAMVVDNITARFDLIYAQDNMSYGIREETSAFPLPSTATIVEHRSRSFLPNMALTALT